MKQVLLGFTAGAALLAGVWGLVWLTDEPKKSPEVAATPGAAVRPSNSGVLDMICELRLDLDGQLALGITANEPSRMAMAQVDFDKASGWYQGRIAISESRAGNLTVIGPKLKATLKVVLHADVQLNPTVEMACQHVNLACTGSAFLGCEGFSQGLAQGVDVDSLMVQLLPRRKLDTTP